MANNMKRDLLNMSSQELETLENDLTILLDAKLRNMKYDEELEELYRNIEQLNEELKRRESSV